jgi:uncharacterized membrane protein YdbT with pleckstrin-like domain
VSRFGRRREVVHATTSLHGVALVRPLAAALVLAAGGAGLVFAALEWLWLLAPLGALALGVAAARAVRAVVRWERTRVLVTDERLVLEHGVLRRRAVEAELPRGAPVEVEQSLLGRLLGYGTLVVGELEIPYVPDPRGLVGGR